MNILAYQELDSTQNEAKRLIDSSGITSQTIICSEYQSAGRGQHGKSWASPIGAGLYMSVVHIADTDNFTLSSDYTILAAEATKEVLLELEEINCDMKSKIHIKPINDIYYENCKLAGILTESKIENNKLKYLITGIGINLLDTKRSLKETHLDIPKAAPISLEEIIGADFGSINLANFKQSLMLAIAERLNLKYSQFWANSRT